MKRSLNEIYRLCQRVAERAGAPAGLDVEAAQNTVWLVARDLPGLAGLVEELERMAGRDDACRLAPAPDDIPLDAGGKAGALLAPALIDTLLARTGTRAGRLAVHALTQPLYLLAAAAPYARSGWWFRLDLRGSGTRRFMLGVGPEAATIAGSAGTSLELLAGTDAFDLQAGCSHDADMLPEGDNSDLRLLADDAVLAAAEARSLAGGVDIDPALWRRLEALAGQ